MVTFTTFLAAKPGKNIDEHLKFIEFGQRRLAQTNPGARYVVLTDSRTAPVLEKLAEIAVVAPDEVPLMIKSIMAQRQFARSSTGLTILADTDCFPNRPLGHATPRDVGFAATHRGAKWNYKINNIGYVRDPDLAYWFLGKALRILESWPVDKQDWWGDQEAWEDALDGFGVKCTPNEDDVFTVPLEGGTVHVYPCLTHNCIVSRVDMKPSRLNAFIHHFKGPRKSLIDEFIALHG